MITRLSTLFLRTLREDPADAEVPSHKLLVRAGYIRRAAPGVYSWLPLGLRTLRKIEDVVREEINAIGGQELLFPALLPREPYETTGRWTEYGDHLFRLFEIAAVGDDDIPTLAGDIQCSLTAKAAVGAGNKCNLSHVRSSLVC